MRQSRSWKISMGGSFVWHPPKKDHQHRWKAIELPRSRFRRRCHISMGRWMAGWPRWLPSLSFMAARLMRIFWLLGDKLGSPATRARKCHLLWIFLQLVILKNQQLLLPATIRITRIAATKTATLSLVIFVAYLNLRSQPLLSPSALLRCRCVLRLWNPTESDLKLQKKDSSNKHWKRVNVFPSISTSKWENNFIQ